MVKRRGSYAQQLLNLTNGFLTASTELLLYWLFFSANLTSAGRKPQNIMRASREASEMVEGIDKEAMRRSLYYLKQKGLVESITDKFSEISISQTGKERLATKFPRYFVSRPWDGKIYLVTYDIVEKRRRQRDLLREHLQHLGCAILQRSVWVSVYDPRAVLREWAEKRDFEEQVIVSDVGRDGSIAGKTIPEIVAELYDLDYVDEQYRLFVERYREMESLSEEEQWQLNLDWAFCVELDPQLPFVLLPSNFSGQEAYQLYSSLARMDLNELFPPEDNDFWEQNKRKHLREQVRERHNARPILGNRFTRRDFVDELELP